MWWFSWMNHQSHLLGWLEELCQSFGNRSLNRKNPEIIQVFECWIWRVSSCATKPCGSAKYLRQHRPENEWKSNKKKLSRRSKCPKSSSQRHSGHTPYKVPRKRMISPPFQVPLKNSSPRFQKSRFKRSFSISKIPPKNVFDLTNPYHNTD